MQSARSVLLLLMAATWSAPADGVDRRIFVEDLGDPRANGAALRAAVARATPGRWLIELSPAIYLLDSTPLVLPAEVSLHGVSQKLSEIRVDPMAAPSVTAVQAMGWLEIRDLRILMPCAAANRRCVGVEALGRSFPVWISDVTIDVRGASDENIGVLASTRTSLSETDILVQGGEFATAARLAGEGALIVKGSDLRALFGRKQCAVVEGTSTGNVSSLLEHSVLFAQCLHPAPNYWLDATTRDPIRTSFNQILGTLRRGTASCVANRRAGSFFAETCPP